MPPIDGRMKVVMMMFTQLDVDVNFIEAINS
jgi:hypothetical protein